MNNSPDLAERIARAAAFFLNRPGIGLTTADDLHRLLELELAPHGAAALEHPVTGPGGWRRALPPRAIYHVLASNLAVSAEASLLFGWVLGARLWFKLPSGGLPDFTALLERLPPEVNATALSAHDPKLMNQCDAIVAYGSDDSITALRGQTLGAPRFLAYGSKVSLGWIPPGAATPEHARRAAAEVAAFHQRGCLSPQAYLCADLADAERFARLLADSLLPYAAALTPPAGAAATVREWHLRAHARGDTVHPLSASPGPAVVVRQSAVFEPGPGYGCVDVITTTDPTTLLTPWAGRISTLSIAGTPPYAPAHWALAETLRITRLCPIGDAQNPPLIWTHDGRPRLADLLTWVSADA